MAFGYPPRFLCGHWSPQLFYVKIRYEL